MPSTKASKSGMGNRHTVITIPGISPDVFPWDKYPLPKYLFKYLPPERFQVLTHCLIRFSQRQVFEDKFELRPAITRFGNEEAMLKFMEIDPVLNQRPLPFRQLVAEHILSNPEREAALLEQARGWMTSIDQCGVLCLSEDNNCERMWHEYAGQKHGFVIVFDTTDPSFKQLTTPGRIGKVDYSDDPFPDFLTTYGPNTFFRKRTQYTFEKEWRSIRWLTRFGEGNVLKLDGQLPIYLSPFNPSCIRTLLIRRECSIEWELRTLTAVDARYQHVAVDLQ